MGHVNLLRCRHCGNTWEHWEGVGFEGKPIKGSVEENTTGDADEKICCPKCGSEDFELEEPELMGLWD